MKHKPILPKLLTLVLLLAAVLVLAALLLLPEKELPALPEPTATPIPPTPTPATQDEAVRNAVEDTLRYVATFQGGDDPALILPFVSTGEFGTLTFDLDRQPVQADVVYAYTTNAARQLLIVPVAIGAVFPDGVYRSFDTLAYGKPVDTAARQALKDKLVRGMAFKASIYGFVEFLGKYADWERCDLDAIVCQTSAQLARPDIELGLVMRTVREFPSDWALFGWSINANNPPDEPPWKAELP